jgi:hypothetical protein
LSIFGPPSTSRELVEEARRTEVPNRVALAAWAVAWCLRHPAVSSAVTGSKSIQLQGTAAAADLALVGSDHPGRESPAGRSPTPSHHLATTASIDDGGVPIRPGAGPMGQY